MVNNIGSNRKHIIFYKVGSFSNINSNVLAELEQHFPDCSIEVIDIHEWYKKLSIINKTLSYVYLVLEYGLDFITKKKSYGEFRSWLIVTSFMFKLIKKKAIYLVKNEPTKYLFSFQTQSLFDASSNIIPHFVYTDSTVLANVNYPEINMDRIMKSNKWMKLEPSIYQNADLNFTFSSNQSNSIVQQYFVPEHKVVCVFAGSNLSLEVKERQTPNYQSKIILFVGVNWERKGGEVLYQAFLRLLKVVPDAKLTIVGCSPNINHPSVDVVGRINLERVSNFYRNATVFCMPSKIEPFGIVYIEAMSYSLPIVASRIGALPDLVKDDFNGYLHEYNDVEGISNSLISLLNSPELCKEMGKNGFELCTQNYNWKAVGRKFEMHIKSVLK